MICVPIIDPTIEGMRGKVQAAADLADLIELRVDSLEEPVRLEALLADRPRPVIVTCRARAEGGLFKGSEKARCAILQEAIDVGASYVDVELASVAGIRRGAGTKLIVSVHDFKRTPRDLARIHRDALAAGADIVKIAATATDIADNLRMFELLVSASAPTVALCMGEVGQISRVLGRKFGAAITYGSLDAGQESAPGQITAADLRALYRYQTIDQHTEIFGVIGRPVSHSMSPAIHNAAFDEAGINAVYVPFLVDDVAAFLEAFREIAVRGYSVTLPHKEAALAACDEVDDAARRVGAINTVLAENGTLKGFNCDYAAVVTCLEKALGKRGRGRRSPLAGKRVAVVGAGGVARTVAFAASDHGAEVTIYNRTLKRGKALAGDVGDRSVAARLGDLAGADYDALVNCTPVGMTPDVDASPVPAEALRKGALVFDTVYTPLETRLIREARHAGCRTLTGLDMFITQAVHQFGLWTGQKAPRGLMRRVVTQRLKVLG